MCLRERDIKVDRQNDLEAKNVIVCGKMDKRSIEMKYRYPCFGDFGVFKLGFGNVSLSQNVQNHSYTAKKQTNNV